MVNELRFRLAIPAEEAVKYYQGHARSVVVTTENGQRIKFPAEHIRPHIDSTGVHGYFSIQFNSDNKLVSLKRLTR